MRTLLWLAVSLILAACEPSTTAEPESKVSEFILPEPVTNNAVAVAEGPEGPTVYSFNGLKSGKTWKDTSNSAYACVIAKRECEPIKPVPVVDGRLASAAVTVAGKIYVFGGYTVAENGDEESTPEVFAFDPQTESYEAKKDMPTPVDDMVAAAYRDRYIYLVSGWHDEGNVSLVQVYDTRLDSWFQATRFPGKPVFGHAGGISGDSIIIADGVAVAGIVNGRRKFEEVPFVWRGDIDPSNPAVIDWRAVDPHPGGPRYRMASIGDGQASQVLFAGGGDNPYNYNGTGYDGKPARPSDRVFAYDLASDKWMEKGVMPAATMDHRGLVKSGNSLYTIGGMDKELNVIKHVRELAISE